MGLLTLSRLHRNLAPFGHAALVGSCVALVRRAVSGALFGWTSFALIPRLVGLRLGRLVGRLWFRALQLIRNILHCLGQRSSLVIRLLVDLLLLLGSFDVINELLRHVLVNIRFFQRALKIIRGRFIAQQIIHVLLVQAQIAQRFAGAVELLVNRRVARLGQLLTHIA